MAAGLGMLRLEPRAFWSMSPKELEAAMRALIGPAGIDEPPRRDELRGLMLQFPDYEDHT